MVRSRFSIYGRKHTYLSTASLLAGSRHAIGRMSAAAAWVQSLGPGSEIAVRPGHLVKKGNAESAVLQQVIVKEASIERDLVSSAGASYVRVAVTDHTRPLNDAVDRFIVAVRALPENAWAHFHCEAGLG